MAQLFQFTGSGKMPSPLRADPKTSLPGNWVIEWDRFVHAETPLRSALRIDTPPAPSLDDMINQPARPAVMKRLDRRSLRRG